MKFKEENTVEVLRKKSDPCGSWFPGKIISVDGDQYTVRYDIFMNHKGEPVVEKVHKEIVRPQPPPLVRKERWVRGDIVEVFDAHSWRVGKIAKVMKDNQFVVTLFGSIQLREFQRSSLRVRQVWHNNKWIIIEKVGGNKQINNNITQNSSKYSRGLGCEDPQQGTHEETHTRARIWQEHVKTFPPVKSLRRDYDCHFNSSPRDVAVGGGYKKRKTIIKVGECDKPAIRTVSVLKQVVAVSSPEAKIGEKCINRSSEMDVKTDKTDNCSLRLSSMPLWDTEESNKCSVASCSSNDFGDYTVRNSRKSSRIIDGSSFDDAWSSCPSVSGREYVPSLAEDKLEANIHRLEQHAYKSTVQAFYASGPLSWEQESLLTNLRISLHISNEEHLLQLRQLLSSQVL